MFYISINAHTIRKNAITGTTEAPIRVARSPNGKAVYAFDVWVAGPIRLRYSPKERIMACGARLVLMADADILIRETERSGWKLLENKGGPAHDAYSATHPDRDAGQRTRVRRVHRRKSKEARLRNHSRKTRGRGRSRVRVP